MELSTRTGVEFTAKSISIGDFIISGLLKILNSNKQFLHTTLGVSIPKDDIDQRDVTPMTEDAQLAYPM